MSGVIKELKVEEGATVPVGTEILSIDEAAMLPSHLRPSPCKEAPAPAPAPVLSQKRLHLLRLPTPRSCSCPGGTVGWRERPLTTAVSAAARNAGRYDRICGRSYASGPRRNVHGQQLLLRPQVAPRAKKSY